MTTVSRTYPAIGNDIHELQNLLYSNKRNMLKRRILFPYSTDRNPQQISSAEVLRPKYKKVFPQINMVYHLLIMFLRWKCSEKNYWPEGPKILGDEKLCAGDQNLKPSEPADPKDFFLKSSPGNFDISK